MALNCFRDIAGLADLFGQQRSLVGEEAHLLNTNAHWTVTSATIIIDLTSRPTDKVRILELFSGAVGGWSYAAHFLRAQHGIPSQIVSLDSNAEAVKFFAIAHEAVMIGEHAQIPIGLFDAPHDFAIHSDVYSENWVPAVAAWKPLVATLSPPCPPWSGAGTQPGLLSTQGQAFPEALCKIKMLRPSVVLLEQVPGFKSHEHHNYIKTQLVAAGYTIRWQQVIDASSFAATSRPRWLCLATLRNDPLVKFQSFNMWPEHPKQSPNTLGSVLSDDLVDLEGLYISEEIKAIASQKRFLPSCIRHRFSENGEAVLASRCHSGDTTLPTFMAMYGSQHTLDESTMASRGLLAHYFKDIEGHIRHWHPIEVGLHHTMWQRMVLPTNCVQAWKYQGNAITPAHSILMFCNAFQALDLDFDIPSVDHAVTTYWDNRLNRNNIHITRVGHTFLIQHSELDSPGTTTIAAIDALFAYSVPSPFPQDQAWSAALGFFPLDLWDAHLLPIPPGQGQPEILTVLSQVTDQEEPELTISPTIEYAPILKGQCCIANQELFFWFSADLDLQILVELWDRAFKIDYDFPRTESVALKLLPTAAQTTDNRSRLEVMCFIQDGCLTVVNPTEANLRILKHQMQIQFYDQFGPSLALFTEQHQIFLDFDINGALPSTDASPIVLAALQGCHFNINVDQHHHTLQIHFQATPVEIATIHRLFLQLFPQQEMRQISFICDIQVTAQGLLCVFRPASDKCVVPIVALRSFITVRIFRALISGLESPDGLPIKIKWQQRPLWEGNLSGTTPLQVLSTFLRLATCAQPDQGIHHFIVRGQQQSLGTTIAQIHELVQDLAIDAPVLHSTLSRNNGVLRLTGGGGSSGTTTKANHALQVKNSLASTLLSEGHDLQEVSRIIESIQKGGNKNLAGIASMPAGPQKTQALYQLIKDCGEQITMVKPHAVSKVALNNRLKKQKPFIPNPSDYTVTDGYLLFADGSQATQLPAVNPKKAGFTLISHEEAIPWMRSTAPVSADECAIIILGELPTETTRPHQRLTLPCQDCQGRQVMMACHIIQLGQNEIKQAALDPHKVNEEHTVLVALTMWKTDWESQWKDIVQNPIAHVKQILGHDHLVAVWGKSYRQGRSPTTPTASTSVQMHATIRSDNLPAVLNESGFNAVWVTPKQKDGSLSPDWKLLWLDHQQDVAQLRILCAQTPGAAGIVRVKQRHAIRVAKDSFEKAWQHVFPGVAIPEQVDTSRTFKVEGLPFGVTADMVAAWLKHIKWTAKGLRAIGPRGWVIGTAEEPPKGPLVFNTMPVLVREMNPRTANSHPVIAGPKGRPMTSSPTALGSQDPWAAWAANHPNTASPAAPATRTAAGPIESKFANHEQKLQQLEQSLQQVVQGQAQQQGAIQQLQQDTVRMEQSTKTYIDQSMASLKTDIDQQFTQALKTQSQQFDSNMAELKQLILQASKRKQPSEGPDHDMESGS
eukprot:Skav225870  [mRNA]  locus=scaffold810:358073:362708:- [translate_table: standard]